MGMKMIVMINDDASVAAEDTSTDDDTDEARIVETQWPKPRGCLVMLVMLLIVTSGDGDAGR